MKAPPYEIRDPIHGLIELSQKELDIINTKAFQRLRRIRQLAMTFLVYPGTLHTRFDHSIGVMHIAGRICDRLKQRGEISDEDCKRVRLAALLHDIGHGPFSHVSEYLLEKHATDEAREISVREKIHEQVTVDILENDSEIGNVFSSEEGEFVVEIIKGKTTRDFRRDIVSSDLDADKMDYLLRDSYFAGVKYGMYDLEKIIESCQVSCEEDQSYLAISDEGIYALEQLLLARYHMSQQVYFHRVRLISNAMIVRGVEIAIREGNQKLIQLYQYDGSPKFIRNYMKYHDERLIDILKGCTQKNARSIFNRLYERRLFKRISELQLKEDFSGPAKTRFLQMDDSQKLRWEERIAKHLKLHPDFVIVNKPRTRSPNYRSRSHRLNPEQVMIFDNKQCRPRSLSEYADELAVARLVDDETALETVQVYAPVDGWSRQQEESQIREILLNP